MHLTILGCRSAMPDSGQASSGYLVQHNGTNILLDAGPGIALRLSDVLPAESLSAVYISHQHTDHLYDLLPIGKMIIMRHIRFGASIESPEVSGFEPIPLFVPEGAREKLEALARIFPVTTNPLLDRAFEVAFELHEYQPGESFSVNDLALRTGLLRHVSPDCGVRIEAGEQSLVYTGDTGVTDALPELAAGAGTLLCECTLELPETGSHGHLCSEDAGRAAAQAGVSELILTHFSTADRDKLEWHKKTASKLFGGPVNIAQPGAAFSIASGRGALA